MPMVPFNIHGQVCIKKEAVRRFMGHFSRSDIRRWHSKAADWWTDNGQGADDDRELLHHLFEAGRFHEASRLAKRRMYALMESPDMESLEIVRGLDGIRADDVLLAMGVRMAMRLSLLDTAADMLSGRGFDDDSLKDALMSEILLRQGRTDQALSMALENYRGDA